MTPAQHSNCGSRRQWNQQHAPGAMLAEHEECTTALFLGKGDFHCALRRVLVNRRSGGFY